MRRILVTLVLVGCVTLAATTATATDPAPTGANGHVNPQVGAVVGRYEKQPDGACDLGAAGLTLTASPDAGEEATVAVEINEDCAAVVVAADASVVAPGGVTVEAKQ